MPSWLFSPGGSSANDAATGRYCFRHGLRMYALFLEKNTATRSEHGMLNNGIGLGAAYGTAKSGIGIAGVGTFRPDLIMKVYKRAAILRKASFNKQRSV